MFDGLATASIDRAVGSPISQWSPLSDAARPLRRLQNEMQMLLYTERVNDERTARGVPPINSFWLSGTGRLPAAVDATARSRPRSSTRCARRPCATMAPAWAAAWAALDAGPVADLLAAYTRGRRRHAHAVRRPQRAGASACSGAASSGWAKGLFDRQRAAAVLEAL